MMKMIRYELVRIPEKMQKSYAFYLEIEKIAVYLHSENEQMV